MGWAGVGIRVTFGVGVGLVTAFSAASAQTGALALTECRLPGLAHAVLCGVVERPLAPLQGELPASPPAPPAPPRPLQRAASAAGAVTSVSPAVTPAATPAATINIHYVVVPAMARRKLPDPVFLLAGGPGQSAIGAAPSLLPLFTRLNNRRDIVFVDQRGTGRSAPLACPQRAGPNDSNADADADLDADQQVEQMRACQAALLKLPYIRTPGDLGHFTTTLAMHDLDAVRAQLGAPRINLVGVSYGTRAALEYMRLYPGRARRVVLDAVAPPDMALPASMSTDAQAAWDGWLRFCERDAACHADYPRLRGDWAALLKSLPKTLTVTDPRSGLPQRLRVTRETVLALLRGALYTPAVAAALPAAIQAAAAGRWQALLGLGALQRPRPDLQPALGMHFSVVCAEDMAAPPTVKRPANPPGADFGSTGSTLYQRVCARWPRGPVPAAFYGVPATTTPTLLFSGGLDPATPPRHGARVAQALGSAARHVVVANAGHGVLGIGCARDVVFRFIDAEGDGDDERAATGVDASCLNGIPHPSAFAPLRQPGPAPARTPIRLTPGTPTHVPPTGAAP